MTRRVPLAHQLVARALKTGTRRNPAFLLPLLHHELVRWTGRKAVGSALLHQSKSLGYQNPPARRVKVPKGMNLSDVRRMSTWRKWHWKHGHKNARRH